MNRDLAIRRNPILGLPAARRLAELDEETKDVLREVLRDLAADALQRADTAWASSKAPMAAYWKAVATYAKHTRLALHQATEVEAPRIRCKADDFSSVLTRPQRERLAELWNKEPDLDISERLERDQLTKLMRP